MQSIHTTLQISRILIEFDNSDPLCIGGESSDYFLTLDGIHLHKQEKELKIAKIEVTRLMLPNQNQVSIPLMTFLPLKEGELPNQIWNAMKLS